MITEQKMNLIRELNKISPISLDQLDIFLDCSTRTLYYMLMHEKRFIQNYKKNFGQNNYFIQEENKHDRKN